MDEEFVLSEVADMLMREEYILTVISNFDVEGEGYLRKDDV